MGPLVRATSLHLSKFLGSGLLTAVFWLSILGVMPSWAEEAVTDPLMKEDTKPLEKEAANSIEGTLEQRDELVYDPRRRSLFPDFYYAFRKKQLDWWQKHRVEFTSEL